MSRNVYDFDGTIYRGDSTKRFYLFCAARYPRVLLSLPGAVLAAAAHRCGLLSAEDFKRRFYRSFLPAVPPGAEERFWNREILRIQSWYPERKLPTDVIISASPEFLLAPVCARLGVSLLASQVDRSTGALCGPNLKGAEKVAAFRAAYPGETVDCFYSDSASDAPMARIAQRAWIVKNRSLREWNP